MKIINTLEREGNIDKHNVQLFNLNSPLWAVCNMINQINLNGRDAHFITNSNGSGIEIVWEERI